jgi:3-dehydroquinate dehydratase/shikimate dehydrogenase
VSTLICVSIMVHGMEPALRDAAAAKAGGADLVEYRLDEFYEPDAPARERARSASEGSIDDIVRLISESPLPCIATCRTQEGGGHYDGDEQSRIALFERLGTAFGQGEHPPRYLDVELSTLDRSANIRQKVRLAVEHPEQVRDVRTSLIVSTHDFTGRPADLTRRLLRMREEPAAKVLKVAYRARSLRDNLELFDLLAERDRPTIALGMGEFGLMSRVLAPKFGGFLTYCGLRDQTTTAPGQPTLAELLDLYRFRSIGPATTVFGVIGWPLAHSRSPRVHNTAFAAAGINAVYLPLPIAAESADALLALKATLLPLIDHPNIDFAGASVTHPFKTALVELARTQGWRVDEASNEIGAANTLTIHDGRVAVTNTDAPAVRAVMTRALADLAGRRIAVLGAGGMARAAAFACVGAGARVEVVNRTSERAAALAEALRVAVGSGPAPRGDFDAVIHCTPLGMAGSDGEGQSVLTLDQLRALSPGTLILDTVYAPRDTPLLVAAREAGLRTLGGLGLFLAQAALQFTAWTGRPPPPDAYTAGVEAPTAEA